MSRLLEWWWADWMIGLKGQCWRAHSLPWSWLWVEMIIRDPSWDLSCLIALPVTWRKRQNVPLLSLWIIATSWVLPKCSWTEQPFKESYPHYKNEPLGTSNKRKYKVLHRSQDNPLQYYCLETDWGAAMWKRTWEYIWEAKQGPQGMLAMMKTSMRLGCINSIASKLREVIIPLHLTVIRTEL